MKIKTGICGKSWPKRESIFNAFQEFIPRVYTGHAQMFLVNLVKKDRVVFTVVLSLQFAQI